VRNFDAKFRILPEKIALRTPMKTFRYPGVKPFAAEDSPNFFGRSRDIKQLFNLIFVEQTVVLYGKSGMGKTSLLNAGILPKLKKNTDLQEINIRFGNYSPEAPTSPTQIFIDKIKAHFEALPPTCFLDSLIANDPSFWYLFKKQQIQNQEAEFILIFDQFEELFTYPPSEIQQFKEQLAELLQVQIPHRFRKILRKKFRKSKNGTDEEFLSEEQMQLLMSVSLNIRAIFSIRSDRMSRLNKFADQIPDILSHCYELEPLSVKQAEVAMLRPARNEGSFNSPTFQFQEEAIEQILNFLSQDKTQQVEASQLQIFCEYVENLIIERAKPLKGIEPTGLWVKVEDLGDLNKVFENYYENQIQKLEENEQQDARIFIEENLIKNNRRISLDEALISDISPELLRKLINTHLLRVEPNTTGGNSYELSHDTLIEPVLQARHRRVRAELQEKEFYEENKQKRIKTRKRVQNALVVFVLAVGSLSWFQFETGGMSQIQFWIVMGLISPFFILYTTSQLKFLATKPRKLLQETSPKNRKQKMYVTYFLIFIQFIIVFYALQERATGEIDFNMALAWIIGGQLTLGGWLGINFKNLFEI